MASKTVKAALAEVLDDLAAEDFERFRDQLLDRRQQPRVRRSRLEGKRRWEVADVMVSTFTEDKCLDVAVEILKQIGCCDQAEELDSQTKLLRDNGDPTFRKTSDGRLDLKPTTETLKFGGPTAKGRVVKKPRKVAAEAKNRVPSKGSRSTIKFGKHKGRTFKWLLKNKMAYVAWLVNSHQEQPRGSKRHTDPHLSNKDALTRYATRCPGFLNVLKLQKEKRRLQKGPDSQTKHLQDNGDPTFRKTSDGRLDLKPTTETPTSGGPTAKGRVVKNPEEVEAEARKRVLSEGGDPSNDRLVLSRFIIQLGKYRDQTFKWLLENDVRYVVWLVNSHQEQPRGSTCPTNPLMSNKDALTRYATAYPEFVKEVELRNNKAPVAGPAHAK